MMLPPRDNPTRPVFVAARGMTWVGGLMFGIGCVVFLFVTLELLNARFRIGELRLIVLALFLTVGTGLMLLYWAVYIQAFRRSAATGGAVVNGSIATLLLARMLWLAVRGERVADIIALMFVFALFAHLCRNCLAARRAITERASRGFEPLPISDDLPVAMRKDNENHSSH